MTAAKQRAERRANYSRRLAEQRREASRCDYCAADATYRDGSVVSHHKACGEHEPLAKQAAHHDRCVIEA
jgi:hypothetical protein